MDLWYVSDRAKIGKKLAENQGCVAFTNKHDLCGDCDILKRWLAICLRILIFGILKKSLELASESKNVSSLIFFFLTKVFTQRTVFILRQVKSISVKRQQISIEKWRQRIKMSTWLQYHTNGCQVALRKCHISEKVKILRFWKNETQIMLVYFDQTYVSFFAEVLADTFFKEI